MACYTLIREKNPQRQLRLYSCYQNSKQKGLNNMGGGKGKKDV